MKKLIWLLVCFLPWQWAGAFGKNKVTYHEYNWYILESPHFRIYVTELDQSLSNLILDTAEQAYALHARQFGYQPKYKIKVLLYPNQIDFQQNNVTTDFIGAGTGGFTEFIKGRVVLPFSGDYANFEHILSHELTHAFQGYTWGRGYMGISALMDINVPLWFIEGMAEYASIGLDNEAEMMVSDALYHGNLPNLMQLSYLNLLPPDYYFFVYKEGQLFFYFAEQKYGTNILPRLNESVASNRNLNVILTNVFHKDLETLNDEFFDFLKARYLPESIGKANITMQAKRILNKDTRFNMNPVYVDSSRIAFISDRLLYPSIVIADRRKQTLKRLIKGGFDENYLEFQYGKRNNLSMAGTNILCFVSRSGGRDAIQLLDINTLKEKTLDLPFKVIHSPQISPDGKKIVLSANREHQEDIFIYEIETGNLVQVTQDIYFDTQPRWLSSNKIVFVTSRYHPQDQDNKDIVIFDLDSNQVLTRLDSGFSDEYPTISPDQRYVGFVSASRHPVLMIYDRDSAQVWQELAPRGGILSPQFGTSNHIILTAYRDNQFNIYEYKAQFKTKATNVVIEDMAGRQAGVPLEFLSRMTLPPQPYKLELSIDNLIGAFALNSSLKGMALVGIMNVSDLLGDHRFQLVLDSQIQIQTNFFDYINADLSYHNEKNRINYGFRFFNFSNFFYEFHTFESFTLLERSYAWSAGLYVFASYPFSTFSRLDLTLGIRGYKYIENVTLVGSNYQYEYSHLNRETLQLTWVYDATLWDYTGPVDGIRMEAGIEQSFAILSNSIQYTRLLFDFRHYIMLFPNYSLAYRAVLGKSLGRDRMDYPYTVGGFNSVRGYDLFSFTGDSLYLINLEFRFPLIIDWTIGFPFPLRLPTIWGVLFWDMGSAWKWDDGYNLYYYQGENLVLDDLKIGLGFGFRLVLLPGIKFMVDVATPYDGRGVPSLSTWRSFWQIGVDF